MAILKDNTNGTTIEGHKFVIEELQEYSLGDFHPIGRINSMSTKEYPEKHDIFNVLDKVSKSAYTLFNQIKNNRDWTNNIAHVPTTGLNTSQKVMLRSRLKELKDQDIIRKAKTIDQRKPVKKNSFMINPLLLKCGKYQKDAEEMWQLLNL